MKWAKKLPILKHSNSYLCEQNMEKINQRSCYNRIWSWSSVPCEKHGPRASVTTKHRPSLSVFVYWVPRAMFFSWEIMIKSNNSSSWRTFCFSDLGNGPYVVFHYMAFLINWQWIKWICSILVSVAKLGPPYQCLKQNVAWQQISQHVNDPRTSSIWCQLISSDYDNFSEEARSHLSRYSLQISSSAGF